MPQYRGTLVSAELNGRPLPQARFPRDLEGFEELQGDWVLSATVVLGPPPQGVSPVVSIFDRRETEILVLGVEGDDLVLRERTRASAMKLDQPDLRLDGALSHSVGTRVRLEARRDATDRCLAVDNVGQCALGFTPGRTWSLLLYPERISEATRRIVDALWLGALFIPLGLASPRPTRALANAAGAGALTVLAVISTRLVFGPWTEMLGALVGLLGGHVAGRSLRASHQFGS
jgi:hypothetical protein